MAEEPVLSYETKENGRIVVVTMNRPERMNALGGGCGKRCTVASNGSLRTMTPG